MRQSHAVDFLKNAQIQARHARVREAAHEEKAALIKLEICVSLFFLVAGMQG